MLPSLIFLNQEVKLNMLQAKLAELENEATFTLTSDLKLKSIKWDIHDDNDYADVLDAINSTFYINTQKLNTILSSLM